MSGRSIFDVIWMNVGKNGLGPMTRESQGMVNGEKETWVGGWKEW